MNRLLDVGYEPLGGPPKWTRKGEGYLFENVARSGVGLVSKQIGLILWRCRLAQVQRLPSVTQCRPACLFRWHARNCQKVPCKSTSWEESGTDSAAPVKPSVLLPPHAFPNLIRCQTSPNSLIYGANFRNYVRVTDSFALFEGIGSIVSNCDVLQQKGFRVQIKLNL